MKKLIFEIAGILIAAIVLGMAYNLTSTGLPLIYEPPKIEYTNEFENVFGIIDGSTAIDNPDTTKAVAGQDKTPDLQDTAKTVAPQNGRQPGQVDKNGEETAAGDKGTDKGNTEKYRKISYEQLVSKLGNPKLYLIDARSPEAYAKGYIKNAVNIYPHQDQGILVNTLNSIPEDKVIVVYCDGGANCDLSEMIIDILVDLGYKNVFIYHGGWDEWVKKNH